VGHRGVECAVVPIATDLRTIMDPVILIAAFIIIAVEVWIRLL
jgi:hypothetical protein